MTASFRSADSILDELGVTEPGDICLEGIAQHCGATIVYEPLHGCAARILGVGDRAIITINSASPRARQRFSGAHEVGHWMRDRGKITFSCTEQNMLRDWDGNTPERRANNYAAELLLPKKMFEARSKRLEPNFANARDLARCFETSLTATAIRFVELGSFPSMLICSNRNGRKWFTRSPIVPSSLWPTKQPGSGSLAARLLRGETQRSGTETVDAEDWIDHREAHRYCLVEESLMASADDVLTILWWKDEAQIIDLDS